MENYFVLDDTGLIINALACDPSAYPIDPGWIAQSTTPEGVWIGWSTPDAGTTWNPPEAS